MRVIELAQIQEALRSINILPPLESGFVDYSERKAVVPPVSELIFPDSVADVHTKYGYL